MVVYADRAGLPQLARPRRQSTRHDHRQRLTTEQRLTRALLALIETNLGPKVGDPRKVAVWHAFWGEAKPRRVYLERVGSFDEAYHQSLERLFREVIERGGYLGLDAEATTYGFAGLLETLWQEILTDGRRFDRARARRLAHNYLAGLFPRDFAAVAGAPENDESQGESR